MVAMHSLTGWRAELAAQGYRPATVDAKVRAVRLLSEHAGVRPLRIERHHVMAWLGDGERAAWTRLKYLSHVRAWCAYAGIPDATDGIRRPRQPAGVPKPVTEEGLAAMLEVAHSGRERAWIILGAYAGLRSSESAAVRHGDLSAGVLTVMGKGGKLAAVPAAPVVVEELERAGAGLEVGARLWAGATGQAVQAVIRRVAHAAGVECSSHQLRHRYGTRVYAGTHDLLLTQRLMRHSSPATTAGYALIADAEGAAAVAGLPGATTGAATGTDGRPRLYVVR